MIKFYISLLACTFFILTGCTSNKKRLADRTHTDTLSVVQPKVEPSGIKHSYYNVNAQMDLFNKNISFYADNSLENWKLFIQNDSSFTFEWNGKKTVFEFSKGIKAQDIQGIRYSSKKILETSDTSQQKKSITIVISKQANFDLASVSHLPFFVTITLEDQITSITYSGEGFYITNPALNDIWVLDSLNNGKVNPAQFPDGLPRLEFHLDGGKIHGFGGCNELTGNYFMNRNKLNIEIAQIQTMKFCIEASPVESEFLSILNKKRFSYSINNLRLTLIHVDKTKLVFKKVD